MGLHDLTNVHTARHTERVEHDVYRRSVGKKRHVLLGHDLGDHSLVAVPPRHLVAFHDLALLSDVDTNQLVHTRLKLIRGKALQLTAVVG